MDYATLTGATSTPGSIASWLNRAQLQSAAPTIVQEAESFIYRRLRHWKMLTESTGNFTIGASGNNYQDFIALPADYLELKSLYITGIFFQKLTLKSEEEVKASYSYDGNGNRVPQQPMIFYFNQTNFKFDSPADQAYAYELVYYQQPAALSNTNLTNFITATYPRLMRTACMVGAAEFMKDAGVGNYDRTYWETNTLAEIDQAQVESDKAKRAAEVGAVIVGGGDGVGVNSWNGW